MNLDSLQHLIRAVRALAEDCQVIVMGSASLLASSPAEPWFGKSALFTIQ